MIDVTVKTLDSQNHRYSVPDEITVKQFKDRIATSVSIPPDKQRLIYCGRVLQDDKNLAEYGVHEKVIHLVMRAPPQTTSSRSSSSGQSSNSGEFHHRVRSGGATRGPSSSGVRLQQARTMLDRASEVIDQLEELFPSASVNERPSASGTDGTNSSEPMEESPPEPEPSTSTSEPNEEGASASATQPPTQKKDIPPSTLTTHATIPNEDLQFLYTEMDGLNNSYSYNAMDAPMMGGGSNVGVVSTSLAGGLAQAASAAFASALSSMNGSEGEAESGSGRGSAPGTPRTLRRSQVPTEASSRRHHPSTEPLRRPPPPSTESGTGAPNSSRPPPPTSSTTSSSSQPQGSVRGITVRITNRSQRNPSIRLEHPRCNVMVQVFDRYQDVNRRLQPFLHHFYTIMASDPTYENDDDPRMRSDQFVIWRVSAAMHFLSHAMHAISDIIIDLRRGPPRQLRARPIIIPQPAMFQAQINLSASTEGSQPTRINVSRPSSASATRENSSTTTPQQRPTPASTAQTPSSTSSSTANSGPSAMPSLARNLLDLDDGVVVMHVGPSGFSIDSLTGEGPGDGVNPPQELLQNLMSTLTSQFEMGLDGGVPASTASASQASSSPPSTPGGVRNAAPVHNSQAGGNRSSSCPIRSGTNTTNATHTRVTPRPHVHVTPLHVPGMGITQFDPFLPCSSHHVRQHARRRHRATHQTPPASESNRNVPPAAPTEATPSTSTASSSEPNRQDEARIRYSELLNNFSSRMNTGSLSEEQHQQDSLFSQLIQGVVAEIFTTMGVSSSARGSQNRVSLYEFMEPMFGVGNLSSETDSDNFFVRIFDVVSQSLSLQDLVQLFCGGSQHLDQLQEPLRNFVLTQVCDGENTPANRTRGVDAVMRVLDHHITASAVDANVREGIDFCLTMRSFARHRLEMFFELIMKSESASLFGGNLYRFLNRTYEEFIALSLLVLNDGAQGLESLVERRMMAIMSELTPNIQSLSVNVTLRHIRAALALLSISDDQLQQYIVAPTPEESSEQVSTVETSPKPQDEDNSSNDNYVEAMDVDDVGCVEEVATSEVSLVPDEPPLTVTVGSRPWHSAVPQDWIPVITRDVERQRSVRTDNSLSDGYLCGMPLKRRKIAAQNKPHGSVQQVMQDNLRQSLRTSGVNRAVIESVSGEVTNELSDTFASQVRSTLRDHLHENQDFVPEKFPKSEQKIRKK